MALRLPEITLGRKEAHSVRQSSNWSRTTNRPAKRSFAVTGDSFEALRAIIDQFLERGRIAHSNSERGSPAFIVPKKTKGSWRLVVNY